MSNNTRELNPAITEQQYPIVDKSLVQVRGQVNSPGNYTFHDNASVFDYLRSAGGPTYHSVLGDLILIRHQNGKQSSLTFNMDRLHTLPKIQGGDILIFHSLFNVKTPSLTDPGESKFCKRTAYS